MYTVRNLHSHNRDLCLDKMLIEESSEIQSYNLTCCITCRFFVACLTILLWYCVWHMHDTTEINVVELTDCLLFLHN